MLVALVLSMQTPKPAAPTPRVRAELRLSVDRASVRKDEDPGYHATIRNTGREALRLIEPQDGSEVGWRNPAVRWILPDLATPTPIARCGNTNPIEARAFFILAPGQSREIPLHWVGPTELRPGSNRVSLAYGIAPDRKDDGFSGIAPAGVPAPEAGSESARVRESYARLTPITLKSNVVRVTLRVDP